MTTPRTPKLTAAARAAQARLTEARLGIAAELAERKLRRLKEAAVPIAADWAGVYGELLARQMEPGWLPIGLGTQAHRRGASFPFFQTESQLGLIRDLSRIVAGTSNHGKGLLRGLTAFTMGTGFRFKVSPKKGLDDAGKGRATAADTRVTAFLDAWAKRVRWGERQQELYRRAERDGDGLLVMFPADGWLDLRFRWPEQLLQPPGTDAREWSFGVRTDPDDTETPLAYWFASLDNPAEGEEWAAADVVQLVDRETDSGVKRGLPLFSFDARETLDTAARLTRNLGEGSAVRAAIAYMRKHSAAAASDVEAANLAFADYQESRPLSPDRTQNVGKLEPGTVIDFPEGVEHDGAPQDPGTAAHSAVCDLLVRSASSRKNAPEWLATSNSANMAAYTASLVAESPFVKGTTGDQEWIKARLVRVVDRALAEGVAGGHVRPEDLALVDVDLVPPSPEVRNKLDEAQRAAIEIPLGVNSRQNYASEQGRDWDQIDSDNRAWQDEHGSAGAELPLPNADGTLPGAGNPPGV